MDYKSNFLTKNIITYLGNKRKLLPFINEQIENIISNDDDLSKKEKSDIKIFDIFSGSGIVARTLKQAGYYVVANDLEVYTKAINKTFIETNEEDLEEIFKNIPNSLINYLKNNNIKYNDTKDNDSYKRTVDIINSVRSLGNIQTKPYFQKFYAPKNTESPDIENERMFYTQENGQFIDTVLELIFNKDIFNEKAKYIIMASLFHKMTVNINTSGTMKGFHKGWGGRGNTASNRILSDIIIERLQLLSNTPRGVSFIDYAEKVFINNPEFKVDIVYADPPYNQHQYSANYHMLTTAFNNRDYNVGKIEHGKRAGIRKDHNRSDFSKSKKVNYEGYEEKISGAYYAFSEFVKSLSGNTKYLVVSYNQEGVLSHKELIDILSLGGKNKIEIKVKKHEKYKGGKKTNISNHVVEYLFVVKMDQKMSKQDIEKLKTTVISDTKKTLLVGKYLKINNFNEELTEVSLQEDGNYIVYLDKNNNESHYLVLNNEYKIIEENLDEYSPEVFNYIESHEYKDFEKEDLIKQYIEDKNFTPAIKLLKSFKIEKYLHIAESYIIKIKEYSLNQNEKTELKKLIDYLQHFNYINKDEVIEKIDSYLSSGNKEYLGNIRISDSNIVEFLKENKINVLKDINKKDVELKKEFLYKVKQNKKITNTTFYTTFYDEKGIKIKDVL